MRYGFLILMSLGCRDGKVPVNNAVDDTLYCNEDPSSVLLSEDGDCDGVLTVDDCDDTDAESTIVAEDAD